MTGLSALSGQHVLVESDSLNRGRDYLYVGDVADALVQLTLTPHLKQRVYNVSNGVRTPLHVILERIIGHVGEVKTAEGRTNLSAEAERPVLTADRMSQETGWRAATELDEGIAATLEWLRSALPLVAPGLDGGRT